MKPLTQDGAPSGGPIQARRQRIDAVLISSDDSFLIELGPLLGDNYRTHTVDSPLALGKLSHRSSWLAIVDVAALPDARAVVARIAQRYPQTPVIVIAARATEWAAMVARGAIVAVIPREEMAGPRLSDALTAAAARLSVQPQGDAGTGRYRVVAPATADRGSQRRLPVLRALFGWPAVLIAVLGIGAWAYQSWLNHSSRSSAATALAHEHAAPEQAAASAGGAAASSGTGAARRNLSAGAAHSQMILELLSAARIQFHDEKLLFPRAEGEPRGDSALELYAQVLSQDPGNAEALDGVSRLWAIAKARIQSDLASGKLDDATRLVDFFKTAAVSDELLRPVTASINAARPKWTLARAQQSIAAGDLATAAQLIDQLAASGTDPDTLSDLHRTLETKRLEQQLTPLSEQLHAAIRSGALIGPQNDNAIVHLSAMRALSRTHPLTLAAQSDVHAALLARAQLATRTHQFDLADRYISAAAELGNSAEVSDARRQLQDEIQATKAEQQAAAATSQDSRGPAATPAPPSAPATAAPAPAAFIAAAPVRALDATYPDSAGGVEGRVTVEFTLHADGTASDVTVIEAKPKGLFERAAVNAVRRGRYDTHGLADGAPARARISLHFKPE